VRHPELLDILRRADLVTADGMPIVWTSKLLGVPLKDRVTGADLVPKLTQEAARRQKSIYFLGGRGDVGRQAADLLKKRYPNLKVAGTDAPFVHTEGAALSEAEEEDQAIVERINRSGADILLIGFGNPKQEIWFDRNRNRLKVPVSIGIGGTYEFIVGSVARAPVWMQKTGLEWVFRITQDPWRLWNRNCG
jgi:exopolysaccharide biosynthesis WecB/TagA/CpsF family protein